MSAVRALLDRLRSAGNSGDTTVAAALARGDVRFDAFRGGPTATDGAYETLDRIADMLANAMAADEINADAERSAHSLALVEAYCRGRRDERNLAALGADRNFRPSVIADDVRPVAPHAHVTAAVVARLDAMSADEVKATFVDARIIDEGGRLTSLYGGSPASSTALAGAHGEGGES